MEKGERYLKRQEVQEKTITESLLLLKENRKCLVIRPTGFGKTYIDMQIIERGGFKKVIFVYPRLNILEDITSNYDDIVSKVSIKFITYSKMNLLDKDGLLEDFIGDMDGGLFIFDEAHFMGAKDWSVVLEKIFLKYVKSYFLGSTATPDRSDDFSVIAKFFEGSSPFEYSRSEGIRDGIFVKPYYIVGYFNAKGMVRETLEEKLNKMQLLERTRKGKKLTISSSLLKGDLKIEGLSKLLQKTTLKLLGRGSYIKSLVFFPDIESLEKYSTQILEAYKEAFPNLRCRFFKIHSQSSTKTSEILELKRRVMTLDLICCVDKLTYGFHVSNLSHLILLRPTKSNIVYNQQCGRVFSVASEDKTIIYDLVGNFSMNPIIAQKKKSTLSKGVASQAEEVERITREDVVYYDCRKSIDIETISRNLLKVSSDIGAAVVEAYKYKGMPKDFAMKELGISEDDIFEKTLEAYDWV